VVVGWARRSPYPHIHPQRVHTMLMPPRTDAPLRCRRMGETPIYDQVRGERINADVPASGVDPQPASYHGKHRLLADTLVPVTVFGPPGPGAGLGLNQHRRVWTSPAGLPAADEQPAATAWGPRAALPPEAHTRQAPRHAASSPRHSQPTATQQPEAQR
jgi:hypothetical protein